MMMVGCLFYLGFVGSNILELTAWPKHHLVVNLFMILLFCSCNPPHLYFLTLHWLLDN